MREFNTAVREVTEPDDVQKGTPFIVDGHECRCYKPKDGQLAVLMSSTGRHSSTQEQIAGLINFFVAVLDDASHEYIVGRLLDGKDDFGLEQVQDIMEWMVEEWGGRPTQRPYVSTSSPPSAGPNSTLPTPASTS